MPSHGRRATQPIHASHAAIFALGSKIGPSPPGPAGGFRRDGRCHPGMAMSASGCTT